MKLSDHLTKEQQRKLNQKIKPQRKRKRKENIDWKDIMGMNRDTFKRGKGGAIRRK